jgi:integrase/recombinase XerD
MLVRDPSRVRVSGPLAPYAAGYRAELAWQGYSEWTAIAHLQLMEHVSKWLAAHRLDAGGLTEASVCGFLQDRRASGQVRWLSPRGLIPLLAYLRKLGVTPQPEPSPPSAGDPVGGLLAEFAGFLASERGLAEATLRYYRDTAGRFLRWSRLPGRDACGNELAGLTAAEINSFVLGECGRRSLGSVKNVVTALRALLRFLHLRGYISVPLAHAVPAVAGWHRPSLARALRPADVALLLESCDRDTPAGRRDYAVLILQSRMGLRAGEVAALRVDDVDWRAGEILVRGKGNCHELLPLPVDVGQALAAYCRHDRPRGGHRGLLLLARAPYTGMSATTVSATVERACARAGLPPAGAHQLRHAAATALRQAGSPLLEVGQVLRHSHPATTARYGTIEVNELAVVAQAWPGDHAAGCNRRVLDATAGDGVQAGRARSLAHQLRRSPRPGRDPDDHQHRGAGVGHPAAGGAADPVDGAAVRGAWLRSLSGHPGPAGRGAARRLAGLSPPAPHALPVHAG